MERFKKRKLDSNEPVYKFNGLLWTKTFPEMEWKEAVKFCKNLNYGGYGDWRLAARAELALLVDDTKYDPTCILPDTKSSSYWSSTTVVDYTGYAWVMSFGNGVVSGYYKSNSYYVRAVRGGQG